MTFKPTCPICGGRSFETRGARTFAKCLWCGALERTRLLRLCLDHLPPFLPKKPFLHVNPEPALIDRLRRKLGRRYLPCRTARFPDLPPGSLEPLNIAKMSARFREGSLAGILHSHVSKAGSADFIAIVSSFNAALAPGGVHIFSTLVKGEPAKANLATLLTRHFEQFKPIPFADLIDGLDLEAAGVARDALSSVGSNTIIGFQKQRRLGAALNLIPRARKLYDLVPVED